jgi:hypothetical protein
MPRTIVITAPPAASASSPSSGSPPRAGTSSPDRLRHFESGPVLVQHCPISALFTWGAVLSPSFGGPFDPG